MQLLVQWHFIRDRVLNYVKTRVGGHKELNDLLDSINDEYDEGLFAKRNKRTFFTV